VSYVGRYANFKDPGRMFTIRRALPSESGVAVTMAGVARVIESAWIRREPEYVEGERSQGKKELELEHDPGVTAEGVVVYREHPRPWGLQYMAESAVCCDFYHLPADDYGCDTEYAILEMVACGTAVALDPHYLQHCRQFSNPSRAWWDANIFLPISESPTKVELALLLALLDDHALRDEIRRKQLDFMRANHDCEVAFPRLLEEMGLDL